MKPDKTSVYDLFDRQRRYAVPLYQRQYLWNQRDQWAPLWEDVVQKTRQVQAGQVRAPHFLGAIVTSQRQVFGGEMGAWDIIDGQQRLTTLQVLLTAFHDVANAQGEGKYDKDFTRITRNEGVMKDPTSEQYKVWPTNADRKAFQTVMNAGTVNAVAQEYPSLRGRQKRPVHRLVEAYVYFIHRVEKFVVGDANGELIGSSLDRMDALFATFRRHLYLVNIELEVGDDPQVIFESLNGRGVPLLPSDLVRNFVFLKASRAEGDLDRLYGKYWRSFDERRQPGDSNDEPWWKQEERQGRIKRPRIDLFLFHYLQYRLEQEVNIGHLFQEFRNWWDQSGADAETALSDLQAYADEFARWMDPQQPGRTAELCNYLRVLDTSTVYPLMFFLLVESRSKASPGEIDGILQDLESYLVRRAVCGLTNKQYNRFFIGVLQKLRTGGVTRACLRQHLSAGTGDSVRWPGDEEFGRAFVQRPIYRGLRKDVILAILQALEEGLLTPKDERILIVGKLSIEHVLPQSWEKAWPLSEDTEDARDLRERLLHAFGNLTLVTPQFNSSVSNRRFSDKKSELRKTRLLLNKAIEGEPKWDEEAIVARGTSLFDIARKRWPHSLSPMTVDDLSLEYKAEAPWRRGDEDDEAVEEPPIDLATAKSLLDAFVTALAQSPLTPALRNLEMT